MRHKLCRFVIGLVLCAFGVGILALSFEAATSVDRLVWASRDYWLAVFSGLTFMFGMAGFVVGGIAAALAANNFCG